MTCQCLEGRVCDRVYDTGRDLLDAGVIEARIRSPARRRSSSCGRWPTATTVADAMQEPRQARLSSARRPVEHWNWRSGSVTVQTLTSPSERLVCIVAGESPGSRRPSDGSSRRLRRYCGPTSDVWADRAMADYIPDVFRDWVDDDGPNRKTLVVDVDGHAVGLAQAVILTETEAWFQGMRVDSDHRGKGFGSLLTEHLIEWAADAGASVGRSMVFSGTRLGSASRWLLASKRSRRSAGRTPTGGRDARNDCPERPHECVALLAGERRPRCPVRACARQWGELGALDADAGNTRPAGGRPTVRTIVIDGQGYVSATAIVSRCSRSTVGVWSDVDAHERSAIAGARAHGVAERGTHSRDTAPRRPGRVRQREHRGVPDACAR